MIDTTKILKAAQNYQFNRKNAANWDREFEKDKVLDALTDEIDWAASSNDEIFFGKTKQDKLILLYICTNKIEIGVYDSAAEWFKNQKPNPELLEDFVFISNSMDDE